MDQPAILRQYMRHTAQINSGSTVTQTILRSLQFAMTEPKGPVYVWARREIMGELLCDIAGSCTHHTNFISRGRARSTT